MSSPHFAISASNSGVPSAGPASGAWRSSSMYFIGGLLRRLGTTSSPYILTSCSRAGTRHLLPLILHRDVSLGDDDPHAARSSRAGARHRRIPRRVLELRAVDLGSDVVVDLDRRDERTRRRPRRSGRRSTVASPTWDRTWASSRHACHPMGRAIRSTRSRRPTPRPIASQFKLLVLGALAEEVAAGRISWDQTVTVEDAVRSLGNSRRPGRSSSPLPAPRCRSKRPRRR